MSQNKPVIMPTKYHKDGKPLAGTLLDRMNLFGLEDSLSHALYLTKVEYLSDFPHDQQCRDVEAINRKTLFNHLRDAKILPKEFMEGLAKKFLEAAKEAGEVAAIESQNSSEKSAVQSPVTAEFSPVM